MAMTRKHGMGSVEPIRKDNDKHPGEFGGWDHMGFIRGCILKYRGKSASDTEILDYIEKHVKD